MSYAHKMNSVYELWSYHDNGFIIDELWYIISSMTFIMTPTENGWLTWPMVLFVVFTEIEDSILNFCKALLLVCNHLINRPEEFWLWRKLSKIEDWILNSWILFTVIAVIIGYLHRKSSIFVKNPQFLKSDTRSQKCLSYAPKMVFWSPKFFCVYLRYEPSVFCKKLHSIWSNMASTAPYIIYTRI